MAKRKLTVTNQYGIHARAATSLIRLCDAHEEKITVSYNGVVADAKSILDLLMLAAVEHSEVTVEVNGNDIETERDILQNIEALFKKGFYDASE